MTLSQWAAASPGSACGRGVSMFLAAGCSAAPRESTTWPMCAATQAISTNGETLGAAGIVCAGAIATPQLLILSSERVWLCSGRGTRRCLSQGRRAALLKHTVSSVRDVQDRSRRRPAAESLRDPRATHRQCQRDAGHYQRQHRRRLHHDRRTRCRIRRPGTWCDPAAVRRG